MPEIRPVVERVWGTGHYCNYSIRGVDGDFWRASDGRRRRWSTMQAAEAAMAAETNVQIPGPELPLPPPPDTIRETTSGEGIPYDPETGFPLAARYHDPVIVLDEEPEPEYTPGAPPLAREERGKRLKARFPAMTESDIEKALGRG